MSYEPSFSKRPGGAAARPRFFSLLGLGNDASESGAPALKVIIDDDSNPPSSRDGESAVSLMRALDSAGDQSVTCDSSFPPKPQTPTKNQHVVSPVVQKFGRRAAHENKPKSAFHSGIIFFCLSFLPPHCYFAVLSPSKSNQLKESCASLPPNHYGQTAGQKVSTSQKSTPQKPQSPQHAAKCPSPAHQDQPQPLLAVSNENQAPVSSTVISPSIATMKSSNVKFGFSKFGFSFSKPKAASPKPTKTSVPAALGSPIPAVIATPRLPENAPAEEAPPVTVDAASASSLKSVPLEASAANQDTATGNTAVATTLAAVAAPNVPSDPKPQHIVGLSTRAQQLIAELAAEDQSFGALDFIEPVKKEKRVLIEKSNLVRKNAKSGQKYAAQFSSALKSDSNEPVSSRANFIKPVAPQTQVSAPGAAPCVTAPVDNKQVEHLKRVIDNLKAQLEAARNHEKKVVVLENQLAEQSGLVEGMRKEIRQGMPRLPVVSFSSPLTGYISDRRYCSSAKRPSVSPLRSSSTRSSKLKMKTFEC